MKDLINSKSLCVSLLLVLGSSCEQKAKDDNSGDLPQANILESEINDKKIESTNVELEGFLDYGSPVPPYEGKLGDLPSDIIITESRIEMPVFKTSVEQNTSQEKQQPNKPDMATPRIPSD